MRLRYLVRQLVTIGVIGGLLAWAVIAVGSDVTIEVDGRRIAANTHAGTVADVLDDAGIRLGTQDQVEPALTEAVGDGSAIRVTRAVAVVLRFEGRSVDRMRTPARTVADVVRAAGLAPVLGLSVTPDLATPISHG